MDELVQAMLILTPIVLGLTEVVKRTFASKFFPQVDPATADQMSPAISLIVGVGAAFIFQPDLSTANEIAVGILAGLSASGLYSGTRATLNK